MGGNKPVGDANLSLPVAEKTPQIAPVLTEGQVIAQMPAKVADEVARRAGLAGGAELLADGDRGLDDARYYLEKRIKSDDVDLSEKQKQYLCGVTKMILQGDEKSFKDLRVQLEKFEDNPAKMKVMMDELVKVLGKAGIKAKCNLENIGQRKDEDGIPRDVYKADLDIYLTDKRFLRLSSTPGCGGFVVDDLGDRIRIAKNADPAAVFAEISKNLRDNLTVKKG